MSQPSPNKEQECELDGRKVLFSFHMGAIKYFSAGHKFAAPAVYVCICIFAAPAVYVVATEPGKSGNPVNIFSF